MRYYAACNEDALNTSLSISHYIHPALPSSTTLQTELVNQCFPENQLDYITIPTEAQNILVSRDGSSNPSKYEIPDVT